MSTRKASFIAGFFVLVIVLTFLPGARRVLAQDSNSQGTASNGPPRIAQFVALDECDPPTFNAALGPAFCKNVALAAFGYSTTLSNLLAGAQAGHPSPNWDFEPDSMTVSQGTVISVVNQGGEPHSFTEVKNFGGGFLAPLNAPGETTAPECVGGFSTVAVAKTRIIQGSTTLIPNLSKGQHSFQCCIHPWMRVTVNVQ
jgi:plastocyanin